ncbi:Clp protease ClpP [Gordonia amicalis]|uniref:head maturation protease, ClpP-related n=1 Tax=Gordonia amicalis TaxID=89053 RepID=UPI002954AD4A|nr:head maturation protease, ClpP-related [Gordonia amicalis]MDV7101659.1 Clp protease ClpP [Gordonia amicalis]
MVADTLRAGARFNRAGTEQRRRDESWYRITNLAGGSEVMIYEEIGDFGVGAAAFIADLGQIPEKSPVTVRINSPGGDVYAALAITNALRRRSGPITSIVEGLAASAASFIAMAGDEVVMCRNSELMIHDARGLCVGNSTDMAEYAEWLGRASDNIASIYAEKAGGTVASWRTAMKAETWYTAEQAVRAGLADRVDTAQRPSNAARSNHAVSVAAARRRRRASREAR